MGDSKIVNRPLPNSRTWPILLFRLRIAGNSFAIFFLFLHLLILGVNYSSSKFGQQQPVM